MENGDEMMRYGCGMVALASLSLIALAGISGMAEGQDPVVWASFDYSSMTANVEPGNSTNGLVSNTGEIKCDVGNKTQVTVNLTVYCGGWTASISPSNWTFYADGPTEICYAITVQAPVGTSSSIQRNVRVGGNWTADDNSTGSVINSTTIIFIDQYFDLNFTIASKGTVSVRSGGKVKVDLVIQNTGNGLDEYPFGISNYQDLKDDGWFIPVVPKFTIKEGCTRFYQVNFTAPSNSRTYKFHFRVFSEGSWRLDRDQPLEEIVTITVKVKDDGIPFIGPTEIIPLMAGVALFVAFRKRHR